MPEADAEAAIDVAFSKLTDIHNVAAISPIALE